jgi:hypothetical protein
VEDLYEIDEGSLLDFLNEEEEQLDEKSSKRAKRKRRAKKKKKKAKRDACYHKVRARYDVWPSAYASGALVKCRKVGAKNWGNKSKKNEGLELDDHLLQIIAEEHAAVLREFKERIPGGLTSGMEGSMESIHQQLADRHGVSLEQIETEIDRGIEVELEHTTDEEIAHEIAMDHVYEDPAYYSKLGTIEEAKKKRKKRKKAGSESSKESSLRDWFKRKGAPGKKGGWVDCNTCRKGKCKPCGRSGKEKRSKYPSCRPTPSACKERGRGKSWGKKSKKGKK